MSISRCDSRRCWRHARQAFSGVMLWNLGAAVVLARPELRAQTAADDLQAMPLSTNCEAW